MTSKSKNVIGLDFGKSVIKMVEYSRVKEQVITIAKLFIEPSERENESSLSQKMREWITDKKQSKSVEIVSAIPGEYTVIRNVEVPKVEVNVREALSWEMKQYLASSLDQYLIDFQSVGMDESGANNRFLVAAYRKSEIEKLKRMIDFPSLPLTVIEVDVFAAQNAFEINYPESLDKNTLLVKADLHCLNCIHTQHGKFLSFQCISVPEEFLVVEDAERVQIIGDLIKEIETILESGINGDSLSKDIQNLVLCGDLTADFEFGQALESVASLSPVRLNAFKEVKFPHDEEYADKVLETAPQCAAALGLALRFKDDN